MPSWFGWLLLIWAVSDLVVILIRSSINPHVADRVGAGIGVAIQTLVVLGIWVWIING